MSLYKQHKNGMGISWDNFYAVIDRSEKHNGEPSLDLPEGVKDFRDGYHAVVSLAAYDFDRVSSLNIDIRTPAQQLVFQDRVIRWEHSVQMDGRDVKIPQGKQYVVLTPFAEQWLNEYVGPKFEKWDMRSRDNVCNANIFFRRRKDALAFIRMINEVLKGIKFDEY